MATFAFKALDVAGVPTRGEIDADDKQVVVSQLRSRGLTVLDIEEQKPTDVGDLFARFKKVKAEDLTVATRQLSTMVSSGMTLLRAFHVLEEQTENDKLRETFTAVRKDVEAGLSLSSALSRHPDVFNDLYIAMVTAGESGGIAFNWGQFAGNHAFSMAGAAVVKDDAMGFQRGGRLAITGSVALAPREKDPFLQRESGVRIATRLGGQFTW